MGISGVISTRRCNALSSHIRGTTIASSQKQQGMLAHRQLHILPHSEIRALLCQVVNISKPCIISIYRCKSLYRMSVIWCDGKVVGHSTLGICEMKFYVYCSHDQMYKYHVLLCQSSHYLRLLTIAHVGSPCQWIAVTNCISQRMSGPQ